MSEIERAIEVVENWYATLDGEYGPDQERYNAYEHLMSILRAELDREKNPLTWNERINQMTARQKSDFAPTIAIVVERARRYANKRCRNMPWKAAVLMSVYVEKWLNSPYTEGEKE